MCCVHIEYWSLVHLVFIKVLNMTHDGQIVIINIMPFYITKIRQNPRSHSF